jgi:hypothetical protein
MAHEFKFVVDGDLDDRAQALIARAVSDAGSRALLDVLKPDRELISLDVSRIRDWEWIGRVAFLDARAVELSKQVQDFVTR